MVRKKSECSPDDPAATNGTMPEPGGNGTMTKADAVRACMAEAPEMPPAEAVVWIKERFGVEIEPPVFSSYRSQMRRNEGGRNGSPRTRKDSRGEAIAELLTAVRSVRDVVDRHGVVVLNEVLALVERYELPALREMILFIEELIDEQRAVATYRTSAAPGTDFMNDAARGHATH